MRDRWEFLEKVPLQFDKCFVNNFLELSPWEQQLDVVGMAIGNSLNEVHTIDFFAGAAHNIAAIGTRALGDFKAAKGLYALGDYLEQFRQAMPKYVYDRMLEAYHPVEWAAQQARDQADIDRAKKGKQPTSEGARAYRLVAPPITGLPRMQGPTQATGGWRIPPPTAPPYVAAHRARVGYVPKSKVPTPSLLGLRPSSSQTSGFASTSAQPQTPPPLSPYPTITVPPPAGVPNPYPTPTPVAIYPTAYPYPPQPPQLPQPQPHQGAITYDYGAYQYHYYPPRMVLAQPPSTHPTHIPPPSTTTTTPGGIMAHNTHNS